MDRAAPEPVAPATSLLDPRVVQILSTEHWSLLSSRGLVYNEAFTRGGMFLAFVSMSFVALALAAGVVGQGPELLGIAALVLAFDLLVGLTTYARILRANVEDFLVLRGMARIRHAYAEVAPVVLPLFVSGVHDDWQGVAAAYGNPPDKGVAAVVYGLSSSGGMIGLTAVMLGGTLAGVVALALGGSLLLAGAIGCVVAAVVLLAVVQLTRAYWASVLASVPALYPSPDPVPGVAPIPDADTRA